MKKHLLILPLFITLLAQANEQECNVGGDEKVEQLAEQNCEVVDQMATCAQKAPDPDAMKKRITNILETSERDKEKMQKYWNSYQNTIYGKEMFDFNADYKRSDSDYVPQHLIDWMTNDGKAKIDVTAFKAGLIDRYVKFAEKNDCTPVVKHRVYSSDYPQKTFDKKEDIEKLVNTPEYKAERDKFFETYNSRASERGMYCETGRVDTRPFHYVAEQFPPCSGNVSGLFKDNEWATSTLDAKVGTEATNEVTQCIQDRIAKGAKIHHIAVIASASALNNTGAAAKKFCKKGFLGLSQARAETARDKILPGLFSQAGQSSYDQSKVILNYNGGNGDGTSGPCPYRIGADGKEVLKDEFKTPEGKKELDNSKYVTVQVTFDSYQKAVNNNKEHYSGKHYCRQIYFDCAPIQASAPSAKQ